MLQQNPSYSRKSLFAHLIPNFSGSLLIVVFQNEQTKTKLLKAIRKNVEFSRF